MITHTKVQIREFQPADSAAFGKMVTSTLGDSLGEVLPDAELKACAEAYRMHMADQVCYVADAGGTLVGYGTARREPLIESCTHGRVERLYVCRDYLDAVEGEAVAAMLVDTLCSGNTMVDRSIALALYQRWGFVDVAAFGVCLSVPSGHGRFMREALAA